MGFQTRLVTLPEVYDQMYWQGRDNAEKIKYFIKNAIEQWGIDYVLLVGGRSSQFRPTWYCPVRYVHMVDDWESEYLSDLYFADIYDNQGGFSSWDAPIPGRSSSSGASAVLTFILEDEPEIEEVAMAVARDVS